MIIKSKIQTSLLITAAAFMVLLFSSFCTAQSRPMTPEEYKNMVNSLGNENKANLTQQVNTQLKASQKPAPVVTAPPEAKPAVNVNDTSVINAPKPTQEITQPAVENSVPMAPTTVQPAAPQPVMTLPATPSAPQQPQAQPFTGYGNPQQNNQNTNSGNSSDKSSGWKIQY